MSFNGIVSVRLKLYLTEKNTSVLAFDNRPWGSYAVIEENPEFDRKYVAIKPLDADHNGGVLSFQWHDRHIEKYTAITDLRIVHTNNSAAELDVTSELSSDEVLEKIRADLVVTDLKPGETFELGLGWLHAWVNPYVNKEVLLEEKRTSIDPQTLQEIAESAALREQDIYRVWDLTHRNGLPGYPEEVLRMIFTEPQQLALFGLN